MQGKYITREQTVQGCEKIIDGECDYLPEEAFYMAGTLEEVKEKAKTI